MKCGSCKADHDTVQEVKNCFSGEGAFPSLCLHELPPMQCIVERPFRPYNWSTKFSLKWPAKCCFCRKWLEAGDKASKRGTRIAHPECVADPAAELPPPTNYWQDMDALGHPDFGNIPDNGDLLLAAADTLLLELHTLMEDTPAEMVNVLLMEMGSEVWELIADELATLQGEEVGEVALTVGDLPR